MMSAAGLIGIGNKAANLVSFISFILWCIFHNWIITSLNFYYFFRQIFQIFSYLLLDSWKVIKCLFSSQTIVEHDPPTSKRPCISREDVEIVMENLGLNRDTNNMHHHLEPLQDSLEIENMFDGKEASLDEVREAFGLFDENNDGFIDAKELNKVMDSIGLTGFCEQDCKKMIMVFDDNGDGKIDFGEFFKLMEECSC